MPFMNRSRLLDYQCAMVIIMLIFIEGLDEHFKQEIGCGSVLAYMAKYHGQRKFIFRNFLEIFHQVFDGLEYLRRQNLVHRDVKGIM